MSFIKIEVDPGQKAQKMLGNLAAAQVPFAAMRTLNTLAHQVQQDWNAATGKAFDRPVRRTQTAARYTKATKQDLTAQVYLNDTQAGVPAARYLQAEVHGGSRRSTGLERGLERVGLLPKGKIAVPARGQKLNAFGNVTGGIVTQILSQLGALSEVNAKQNQTARSKTRNVGRGSNRTFFAVGYNAKKRDLPPGVYQFVGKRNIKGVYMFVRGARYGKRFEIFDIASQRVRQSARGAYATELQKAVASAKGGVKQ